MRVASTASTALSVAGRPVQIASVSHNFHILACSTIRNTPGIAFLGQKKWGVLVIAVLIDAIGMTSYVLPGIGEAEDAAWAPISAILVQALYGNGIITTIDFLEEALPFRWGTHPSVDWLVG